MNRCSQRESMPCYLGRSRLLHLTHRARQRTLLQAQDAAAKARRRTLQPQQLPARNTEAIIPQPNARVQRCVFKAATTAVSLFSWCANSTTTVMPATLHDGRTLLLRTFFRKLLSRTFFRKLYQERSSERYFKNVLQKDLSGNSSQSSFKNNLQNKNVLERMF